VATLIEGKEPTGSQRAQHRFAALQWVGMGRLLMWVNRVVVCTVHSSNSLKADSSSAT
jgi:hypothetical protein